MTPPTETTESFESVRDRIMAHIRSRGTDAPPAAVHQKLASAYAQLDTTLAGVTEQAATAVPAPGEWSVRDVADHLLESERPGLDELRCLVAGEAPPGPPIPASLRSKAPHHRPWPWLVAELARLHADILAAVASGPAPTAGEPTAPGVFWAEVEGEPREWVEELDWRAYAAVLRVHTLEHLAQIRAILAAVPA
jgi:DinB superfamily